MTCFLSVAGMLPDGVCCGAVVAEWLEIGHSLKTLVSAESAVACYDATLQTETNKEMETTGWNWKVKVMVETESCQREEGTMLTDANCD